MKRINLIMGFIALFMGIFYFMKHKRSSAIEAVPAALHTGVEEVYPVRTGVSNGVNPLSPLLRFQEEFTKIVERTKPAVCNISASYIVERAETFPFEDFFFFPFEDFFEMPKRKYKKRKYKSEATGSGVIINPDGYVLTNEHVVRDADEIKVTVYAGGKEKVYSAEIVGRDHETDIAVIKIKSKKKFPTLPMGDSSTVKIGDFVIAIGSPFGYAQTVTFGIVSAERQRISVQNRVYDDMIQTDAAINKGNSGGPLINMRGEVIGINTAIFAPAGGFLGIGFAIPINKAKDILETLIEKGEVTRGWLGIEMRQVDEVVEKQFGLKSGEGVLVNRVVPGSPAEKAGFKRGDIIIKFNNVKVNDPRSLRKIVQGLPPGRKTKAEVIRYGKAVRIEIKLGKYGEESASAREFEWEGIKVKNISEGEKRDIQEGTEGVVIAEINYSEVLADSLLRTGDIIRGINRKRISNVNDFKEAVKGVKIEEGVIFDILRNGAPIYITFIP